MNYTITFTICQPSEVKNANHAKLASANSTQTDLFLAESYVDSDQYDILILSCEEVKGVMLDFTNATGKPIDFAHGDVKIKKQISHSKMRKLFRFLK